MSIIVYNGHWKHMETTLKVFLFWKFFHFKELKTLFHIQFAQSVMVLISLDNTKRPAFTDFSDDWAPCHRK